MSRRRHRHRHRHAPAGSPPGTLVIDREAPRPIIRVIDYGPEHLAEHQTTDPREIIDFIPSVTDRVRWIDVAGLGDELVLRELGALFDLHPLVLEDVTHVGQRPKVEEYESHRFIVARLPYPQADHELATEQLSLVLGTGFVLSFQERAGDAFEPIRERIRKGRGMIRKCGADHLLYTLVDSAIDLYFPMLDRLGDRIERLEDEVVAAADARVLRQVHELRSDLALVRRHVWPHREMVNALIRDETPLIGADARVHLRDCYDHTVQLIEVLETFRERASGLMEVYLTSLANRTNEVMKLLAVVSVIFIPLNFLAALYGMNFDRSSPYNMPELGWRFGYPLVLGAMFTLMLGMAFAFYRMGWLTRPGTGTVPVKD